MNPLRVLLCLVTALPVSPLRLPAQAEQSTLLERGRYGLDLHLGTGGIGVEVGKALSRHLSARVGGDFIRYTGSFDEQGTAVDANLRLGFAHAQLDFYPSAGNGRFHISPLMVFANQTRAMGTVLINPDTELDLGDGVYTSDPADPLHGMGRVDVRKIAPGLTVGWGNITRGKKRFTYPVEVGFYYVGQPKLTVDFSGSACDHTHPENGCGDIRQDPDFQKDMAAFVARNNHNLSYAHFLPIVNVGVGYRF